MVTPPQVKSPIEKKALEASAKVTLGFWGKLKQMWFGWAEINKHSPWFPFALAVLVGLDAIVVVLPGEIFAVSAVLSNPNAWKKIAFSAGIGSALGALALLLLVRHFGGGWVDHWTHQLGMETTWKQAAGFFREHGLSALMIGSLLPGLTWPPVVFAGLSKGAIFPAFLYLLVGRCARYALLCFSCREGWALFHTVKNKAREERVKKEDSTF
jgi:membrane protein YqaA with SNARE-associated domain